MPGYLVLSDVDGVGLVDDTLGARVEPAVGASVESKEATRYLSSTPVIGIGTPFFAGLT